MDNEGVYDNLDFLTKENRSNLRWTFLNTWHFWDSVHIGL